MAMQSKPRWNLPLDTSGKNEGERVLNKGEKEALFGLRWRHHERGSRTGAKGAFQGAETGCLRLVEPGWLSHAALPAG